MIFDDDEEEDKLEDLPIITESEEEDEPAE